MRAIVCRHESLLLDSTRDTTYQHSESCIKGYGLAAFEDEAAWKAASIFVQNCIGPKQHVWVNSSLGWRGAGTEQWILIAPEQTPRTPFLWDGIDSTKPGVPRAQLAVNLDPRHQLPSLCAKNKL